MIVGRRIAQLLLPLRQFDGGLGGNDLRAVLPESVQSALLVSVTTLFQTDAVVGNRQLELRWQDKDGRLKGIAAATNLQAASAAPEYVWGLVGAAYTSGSGLIFHIPFRMDASGGDVLRLRDASAVSAGDFFTNPIAFFRDVEELPNG